MSKNVKTRIQLKADSSDAWTRASNNGFKVLDREAIFYTDADAAKYPIPMKINLTGEDKAPSELVFIAEYATDEDIKRGLSGGINIDLVVAETNWGADVPYDLPAFYRLNKPFTNARFISNESESLALALPSDVIYFAINTDRGNRSYRLLRTTNCTVSFYKRLMYLEDPDTDPIEYMIYKITNCTQKNIRIEFSQSE